MLNRQLGSYTIVAPLGVDGMGEVYRAHDSKLGRDVAIKILPEHFTSDPERRSRFAREARLLATLNHPNIAAIYGLEESNGVTAIVLELVDGMTLADRIARGPLRLSQAVTIARILEHDPDWQALPTSTPASVRRLLTRCLEKDPKRRLHAIADASFELDEALAASKPGVIVKAAPPQRRIGRWAIAAGIFAVAVAAAVLIEGIADITQDLMRIEHFR